MKSEFNKVLFIINKHAGRGHHPGTERTIVNTCRQYAIGCTIRHTQGPGHAAELASEAAASREYGHVVAVGGDGTVNEVAQGLLHTPLVMGILPRGSGNGLARHLRIPMQPTAALRELLHGRVIAIDTFEINGRLSLNVSGIGFDGHIANLFAGEKKRGLAKYAQHVAREFGSFRSFTAGITHAASTRNETAFIIAIANSSQYGNNARIAPAASVCDGMLDISIVEKIPFFRWDILFDIFQGRIDRTRFCRTIEADRVDIRLPEPMPYHVDGEGCGKNDRFTARILPASIRMIVPEKVLSP